MSFTKSLLLGSAAVLATVVGAQAADLPSKKAAPATYVKICDAYGAGFFFIPGTDTCIKVGGYVRVDYDYRPERKNTTGVAAVKAAAAVDGVWSTSAGGTVSGSSKPPSGVVQLVAPVKEVLAADAYVTNTAGKDNTTSGFYNRGTIQIDARTPTAMGVARTFMALRLETGSGFLAKSATQPSLEGAFVQWAGFTAGQAPHPFGYMSSWAYNTHYWTGWPNGIRQLTYTAVLGGGFSATVGITDAHNYNAVSTAAKDSSNGSTAAIESIDTPGYNGLVYVGNVRYDQAWGSVQVMGAAHSGGDLTVSTASSTLTTGDKKGGYAIGMGATFKLPMLAAGDEIQMTLVYADRLNNLLADAGVNTPSAAAYGSNPLGGPGVTFNDASGWSAGAQLRHYWTAQVRSQLSASYTTRDMHDTTKAGASANAWSLGHALIYSPAKDFDIGLEVNYLRASWNKVATESKWAGYGRGYDASNVTTKLRVQRNF